MKESIVKEEKNEAELINSTNEGSLEENKVEEKEEKKEEQKNSIVEEKNEKESKQSNQPPHQHPSARISQRSR